MTAFAAVEPVLGGINALISAAGLIREAPPPADTAVLSIPHTVYALPAAATQAAVTDNAARTAVVVIGQEIRAGTVAGNRSRAAGSHIIRGVPASPRNARTGTTYCTTAAAVVRICQHIGHDPTAGDRRQ